MTLLRALEICAFLLFGYGVVTQICLPLIMNKPLFPFFSMRKERELQRKLAETIQKRKEQELRDAILQAQLEEIDAEKERFNKLLEREQKETIQ